MRLLPVLLLVGCADPVPAAIKVCEALPGLSIDEAGRAALEGTLAQAELDAGSKEEPTLGLQVVGTEGMAGLRAQTSCTAGERQSAGSGRWAIPLTRTSPAVNADGTLGEPVVTTFEWQVAKTRDGLRVETGLAKAISMRHSAAEATKEEDWKRVASTWRALAKAYPDPLVAVDVADAEALERRMDTLKGLRAAFVEADDTVVRGEITNRNAVAISSFTVAATFEMEPEPVVVEVQGGPVEANGATTVDVPIPMGAEGGVKLKVTAFQE